MTKKKQPKEKRPFLPVVVVDGRELNLANLTPAQREWLKERKEKVARWIRF